MMRAGMIAVCLLGAGTMAKAAEKEEFGVLEKQTFEDGGQKLPYRFLKPQKPAPDRAYPLVVFLHGAGERGNDNEKQLVHGVREFLTPENREKYPCFLIAPQCPVGQKWVEVDWSAKGHTLPKDASSPQRLLFGLIDSLMKGHRIDAKRVYITGLSMGGYGTWDCIARRPGFFAAAVPICGGGDPKNLVFDPTGTGVGLAEKIAQAAKLPIWAFHGDKDTAVRPERSREMIAALKKAGGSPKYTEYPGVGHDSWTRTYKNPELFEWLFKQSR